MTTEIVLIRHGETAWNVIGRLQGGSDVPLSDRGVDQATLVANELRGTAWDVIISSPLQRAYQTAVSIVKELGLDESEIVSHPEFRERSYGHAEGLTIAEREERFPDGIWPDAESPEEMDIRVGAALYELVQQYRGKRVMIVAHGGWIRAALRVASGFDPAVIRLDIPNISRTCIRHDGESWFVGDVGLVEPLVEVER